MNVTCEIYMFFGVFFRLLAWGGLLIWSACIFIWLFLFSHIYFPHVVGFFIMWCLFFWGDFSYDGFLFTRKSSNFIFTVNLFSHINFITHHSSVHAFLYTDFYTLFIFKCQCGYVMWFYLFHMWLFTWLPSDVALFSQIWVADINHSWSHVITYYSHHVQKNPPNDHMSSCVKLTEQNRLKKVQLMKNVFVRPQDGYTAELSMLKKFFTYVT